MLSHTLKLAAFFAMFLMALTAAVQLIETTSHTMDEADRLIAGKDPSVTQSEFAVQAGVSGSEVLQSIYRIADLAVPIEVRTSGGSHWFEPDLDVDLTDFSVIDINLVYIQEPLWGSQGQLERVIYTAE
ncbi:hypothetical protein [Paenibacillus harenae]|uniref:Uncharacterized protein n=1 Tax=Paenibacillus harenae TaxID=306543 RepID=A0ABT9TTI4_PAEHA|nr:hypothetical protein [Paenibacillus harenae]MDQ0110653.1 hypothetical protein [Paenibacillus harenae]